MWFAFFSKSFFLFFWCALPGTGNRLNLVHSTLMLWSLQSLNCLNLTLINGHYIWFAPKCAYFYCLSGIWILFISTTNTHILSSFFSSHPGKFFNKILQTFLGLPNTLANMKTCQSARSKIHFSFSLIAFFLSPKKNLQLCNPILKASPIFS